MRSLGRWRSHSFISFGALAAAVLSLTLYSDPAACEGESETTAPSGSPKQDAQEQPRNPLHGLTVSIILTELVVIKLG
jgi:hypothetical protein